MGFQAKARALLEEWRGERYSFAAGALGQVGRHAAALGERALLVASESRWLAPHLSLVAAGLGEQGVEVLGDPCPGAAPNAPQEDVYRIETYILHRKPDVVVAIGGGSTIDAAKAATALAALGPLSPEVEPYFGEGQVSRGLAATGAQMLPLLAVQTAASSAAHLTRYSNVTDPVAGQKKLIIDDAIVPRRAVFDYSVTRSAPPGLTMDGAFDGMAHCLEVYWGIPEGKAPLARDIALTALELLVEYLPVAVRDPSDLKAREALGLATDLGGYAIMLGGTNGPHLNSFSLVDLASHGRACAILNPYYAVFFAPAIEDRLRAVGGVFRRHGYVATDLQRLDGRELGIAVAGGMTALSRSLDYPATLGELEGFGPGHISRALAAAKNPQLETKLRNMPVPLGPEDVDRYLGPVLRAAASGDFGLIKTATQPAGRG